MTGLIVVPKGSVLAFLLVFALPYLSGLAGWVTLQTNKQITTRFRDTKHWTGFLRSLSGLAFYGAITILALRVFESALRLVEIGRDSIAQQQIQVGSTESLLPTGAGLALLFLVWLPLAGMLAICGAQIRYLSSYLVANASLKTIVSCVASLALAASLLTVNPVWLGPLINPLGRASAYIAETSAVEPFLIAGIGFLISMSLLMLAFSAPLPPQDAESLPKYDTQLRIYATHVILIGSISGASYAGYRLVAATQNPVGAILGVCLMSALVIAVLVHFLTPILVRSAYNIAGDGSTEFRQEFDKTCASRHVVAPSHWTSRVPFLSPQVFGTASRAWLIVPQNIDAIISSIQEWAGVSSSVAVRQFLVHHEIAHLENRDYRYFTWFSIYLRVMTRYWVPAYVLAFVVRIGVGELNVFGFDRVSVLVQLLLAPAIIIGLLIALGRTILRDRELLADRMALRCLDVGSRVHLFEPLFPGTSFGPLAVTMELFTMGPTLAVGMAGKNAPTRDAAKRTASWIIRRLFLGHPPLNARLEALRNKSDALLDSQSSIENGLFTGAILALAYILWGGLIYALNIVPGTAIGFAAEGAMLLIAAGVVGVVYAAPIRHASRIEWSFLEYNWLQLRKGMFTASAAWVVLMVLGLPTVTSSQAQYMWHMLLLVAMGSYVFGLLGAVDVIRLKRAAWSPNALWQIPILIILAIVAAAGFTEGLGTWLAAAMLVVVASFPALPRRT